MRTTIIYVIVLVISTAIWPCLASPNTHETENELVVVMDVHHKPALLNFTKAIGYLNETLNSSIRFYQLNDTINYSTLSGVAIYIVPPSNNTFSDSEKKIIESYVRRGGILLVMGLDSVKDRDFNSDVIVMDDLVSSIPLDTKIHFNFTKGFGNTLIDPLSNDSYLHINESHYSDALKDFLGGKTFNLIVESTIITLDTINISKEMIIHPPPWTYALCYNGTIFYPEGGITIFAMEKYGLGYVVVFGFSLSLSDIVEPTYGKAWIDIAQNKDLWVTILKNLLLSSIRRYQKYFWNTTALWLPPLVVGATLIVLSIILIIKKGKKIEKAKEKREVRLAEMLRRMRRKEK